MTAKNAPSKKTQKKRVKKRNVTFEVDLLENEGSSKSKPVKIIGHAIMYFPVNEVDAMMAIHDVDGIAVFSAPLWRVKEVRKISDSDLAKPVLISSYQKEKLT